LEKLGASMRRVLQLLGIPACVVLTIVLGIGSSSGAAQSHLSAKAKTKAMWTIENTPKLVEEPSVANGVSCESSTECIGVGSFVNPASVDQPLTGVWTGKSWSYTKIPTPGMNETFADGAGFNGVSCDAQHFCVAVGWMGDGNNDPSYSFAAEDGGTRWIVASQAQMGAPSNPYYLASVSCVSGPYCVAVGSMLPSDAPFQPFVEVLSDGSWSAVSTPTQSTNSSFSGVFCKSKDNCMAVGTTGGAPTNETPGGTPLAETWNGSNWTVQPTPLPTGSTVGSLTSVWCSSASACTAVGSYTATSVSESLNEVWDGTAWQIETTPNPEGATNTSLTGVACSATNTCTATGNYTVASGTAETFGEVWNGKKWKLQSIPQPSNGNVPTLDGISCVAGSSISCVSVGSEEPVGGDNSVLADRLVGNSWSVQSAPQLGNPIVELTGVSCPGSGGCEAVGSDLNPSVTGTDQGIALGWNGTTWIVQPTPVLYYDEVEPLPTPLYGVSCAAASLDCIYVGSGTSLVTGQPESPVPWDGEWNGSGAWTGGYLDSTLEATLEGISCYSGDDCVAVGLDNDNPNEPLIYSLGKTAIQETPAIPPGATQSTLYSVWCASKKSCIAVGTYIDSSSDTNGFSESWNGTTWQLQSLPAVQGASESALNGISCESADSCVAVGTYSNDGVTVADAFSWDGSSWQLDSPLSPPGSSESGFNGISCIASSCVAVGFEQLSAGSNAPLVETWNGTSWTIQTTSVPKGATTAIFTGVSCDQTSCMAVGYSAKKSGATEPLTELSAS